MTDHGPVGGAQASLDQIGPPATAGLVVVALGSGAAWKLTGQRCNSSPPGEAGNPEFSFSPYCKAMRFFNYSGGHAGFDATIAAPQALFLLPALVVLGTAGWALRARRARPMLIGIGLAVSGVFALAIASRLFAFANFHGGG